MDRILNIGLLSLKGQWGLLVLIIPIFYKYVVKKTKIRSIRNIWTPVTVLAETVVKQIFNLDHRLYTLQNI